MKTITSKLAALLLVFMGGMLSANAQTTITIDDFSISNGEEVTVAVNMDNDVDIVAANFDFILPTGLELKNYEKNSERISRGVTLRCERQSNGAYRVVLFSLSLSKFKGNSGAIVYLTLKANDALSKTSFIEMNNMSATDANGENVEINNYTAKVTNEPRLDGTANFYSVDESISIKPGETYEVQIALENTATIVGITAELSLPEGLKLVEGFDGLFGYTDRIPEDAEILPYDISEANDGSLYSIYIMSGTVTEIFDEDGTLFTFMVEADETLAAESEIVLNNIVVSDKRANAFNLDEAVTIKVVNPVATGINSASINGAAAEYFTVGGVRTAQPTKGINVVRMSNGEVRKYIAK